MRRFAIAATALAALLVVGAPSARATDARMQGLLYNLAFEDDVDIFLFPNQLPRYRGVYFDLPADVENVYGGVILGSKESAFAAFIHRPWMSPFDQYRILVTDAPVAGTANVLDPGDVGLLQGSPGAATEIHVPGQIFDLMYGAKTWGLGLRFHGWSDVSIREGLLQQSRPGGDMIAVDANAGFRVIDGLDLHANVGMSWISDRATIFRLLLGGRYIDPDAEKIMRYVIAGQLQFAFLSPEVGDSSYGIALPLKGGYRMALIRDALFLGILAGLDFQVISLQGGDTKVGLAIPTLEIGVEWEALEWLNVRSAIKGGYGFQIAGGNGDDHPKFEQMVFSSGIGFLLGPFTLDATIQYALWRNGPDFVSGAAPGLFGSVSLAFNY